MTRKLSDEEMALWESATKNDKAFKPRKAAPASPPPVSKPAAKTPVAPKRIKAPPPPAIGETSNVDAATIKRLKRGDYPIDYTLDLHGMDRARAQDAFAAAVARAWDKGERCLLVITGQGREGGGVLKSLLPVWISLPEIGPTIVSCLPASRKHGGAGAFYVLVRRKRGTVR